MPKFRIMFTETMEVEIEAESLYLANIAAGSYMVERSNRKLLGVEQIDPPLPDPAPKCQDCVDAMPALNGQAEQRRLQRQKERAQRRRDRINVEVE